MDREWEMRVRLRVMDHLLGLREANGGAVPSGLLQERFTVDGLPIAIMSQQQGIHKPRQLGAALTLKTSAANPYDDVIDPGTAGIIRYHYRDPSVASTRAIQMAEADNRAVRLAMHHDLPVAYLMGVDKGWYLPFAPTQVIGDDPAAREFRVDLTELGGVDLSDPEGLIDMVGEGPARRYQVREVRFRVHQARFRQLVLKAYRRACAMCNLRHAELLDAAHILEDSGGGEPLVSNGIALCKIHHAAFDRNILGIRPDTLELQVRNDILLERDGPMLQYGLQSMHGRVLQIPNRAGDRPARDPLEARWDLFLSA